MKFFIKPFTVLIIFIFSFNNIIAQSFTKTTAKKEYTFNQDSLDLIKICKWKNDAKTCVSFSFDDGLPSFRRISQLFDMFGYKASFFVVGTTLQIDSLRDIVYRGHEIANHSYSHPLFDILDSTMVDYQIRKGQEMIENALGVKCICFGEPGDYKSSSCSEIAFKYHLFVRHYSEYQDIQRIELSWQQSNTDKIMPNINDAISRGLLLQVIAHGINGEGYLPITENLIIQALNSIKDFVQNNDVWIATVKEGISYENFYHEVSIEKFMSGDTLTINFRNYKREKYKDLDASILSVEIPYSVSNQISCLTNFVQIKEFSNKFVLTADLKRDTSLVIVLNDKNTRVVNKEKSISKSASMNNEMNIKFSNEPDIANAIINEKKYRLKY